MFRFRTDPMYHTCPVSGDQRSPLSTVLGAACMSATVGVTLGVIVGSTSAYSPKLLYTATRPVLLNDVVGTLPAAPALRTRSPRDGNVSRRTAVSEAPVARHSGSAALTAQGAPAGSSWLRAMGWGSVVAGVSLFARGLFRRHRPPPPQDPVALCIMGGTKQGIGDDDTDRPPLLDAAAGGGPDARARPPEIGCVSLNNSNPNRPKKPYQDGYFVFRVPLHPQRDGPPAPEEEHWVTFAGIMDGHGRKGHLVTKYLQEQIPKRIRQLLAGEMECFDRGAAGEGEGEPVRLFLYEEQLKWFRGRMRTLGNYRGAGDPPAAGGGDDVLPGVLVNSFLLSHLDACQDAAVPAGRSGTTCIVCAIDEKHRRVYTAHVGDSRAILISDGPEGVRPLSAETTTLNMPEERARIAASEGRIDRSGNVWYGPVGISMTRALGDAVMLRAGVVPVPMVDVAEAPGGSVVLLATDGVFDVLKNERVMEVVNAALGEGGGRAQDAAQAVAQGARDCWLGKLPLEVSVDDITCVVVRV